MDLAVLRDDMVEGLAHPSKGVLESETLTVALRDVPRHAFVPAEPEAAYADRAFDRRGSTVIAPSTAALLLEALDLREGQDVLVVGAGVGYTTAVAAEIVGARHVNAIDLSRPLVYEARQNLRETGYREVLVDCRDGTQGLPEYAPFDRILVEAAAVEPPAALLAQLADGGRLVLPLGANDQVLTAVDSTGDVASRHGGVRFQPLLLEGEQAGGIERNRMAREDRERAARAAERRRGWEQEWIDWDRAGGLR